MPPQYYEYREEDEDDDRSLRKYDTEDSILKDDASIMEDKEVVLGSTEIYDKNGNLRLIPVCVYRLSTSTNSTLALGL